MSVIIETTVGDMTVDLYTKERPKSCLNFLKLCKQKKYNLCLFHTVQTNFIAQTGDPSGTGRGGDSIFAEIYGQQARFFEAETNPRIKHTKKGLLSMVNCGNGMLGAQFFLTLGDDLDYLDGEHCVFGELVEGWDILDKINNTICDAHNRPYQDIRVTHTVVLHDPYDDPPGLEPRADSPEPTKEMLASSRIGADEDINDYAGKTEAEINELLASKEERARATILEMVGDLPDVDVAPPENVLFVCKLNPVTNDDDLEIIFSRFGKVKCCEVIRDKKTGDSLQYAFVEFEEQGSCEQAYFKMDNVLIDDRRIHVDFSQSVSKYRWKGKGRLEHVNQHKAGNEGSAQPGGERENRGAERKRSRSKERKDRVPERKRSRSKDRQTRDPERKRSRSIDRKTSKTGRKRSRTTERKVFDSERKRSRSVGRKSESVKQREKDRHIRERSPSENRRRSKDRKKLDGSLEKRRSRSREPLRPRSRSRDRNDRHKDGSKDHRRERSSSRDRRRDRVRLKEEKRSSRRERSYS